MTALATLAWSLASPLLLVLAQAGETPEPEDVKAGWVAFGIWLALAAAVALLGWSLTRRLKKVDFEEVERPRKRGRS
jgi:hypothetical protein